MASGLGYLGATRPAGTVCGMVKARVSDSPRRYSSGLRAGIGDSGDCCPPCAVGEPEEYLPTITVKMRRRNGYTEDGDKRYLWVTIVTGPAIVWAVRQEINDSSGLTVENATAVIEYSGGEHVDETANILTEWGRYRVGAVSYFPDRLEFDLTRVEDNSDGPG